MDIEFGNLMARNNMNVIGERQFEQMPDAERRKTLLARLALAASHKRNLLSVSFDDMSTGKTVATISRQGKGDLLDEDKRTEALETVADVVVRQIQREKGITTSSLTPR